MFKSVAQADATRRSKNEAIFNNFGLALASQDEDRFIAAATKLNGWMKNARAYYTEARPKVRNLETFDTIALIVQ